MLSAVKKSIVVVKATFLCLAHVLILAMVRMNGYLKYALYRDGKCLKKPFEDLLNASGNNLRNCGDLEELRQFQNHLSDYNIIELMD